MSQFNVIIRHLGLQDYSSTWNAMRSFTDERDETTPDEIWVLEHYPVYTQGQSGKPEHLLNPNSIPVVNTDRGGQITYHGPGQLILYPLIDVKRKKLSVRQFVSLLENAVLNFLDSQGITAQAKCEAPGVYVADKKICSIGLRIRRGCSYHGIAFNIAMDLTPFDHINPCGFSDLKMTQLSDFISEPDLYNTGQHLTTYLQQHLNYTNAQIYAGTV